MILTLIAAVPLLASGPVPAAPVTVELQFRTLREWNVLLPAEAFVPVGERIPLFAAGQAGLMVRPDGTALELDRDGDGTMEARVEAPEEPGATQLVVFRLADGSSHALRLRNTGRWQYGPAGAMEGRVGKTAIRLFDQDGNGRFDDLGVDAMIVGRGTTAAFLSSTVLVDGELQDLSVSPDGRQVTLTPYAGPVGQVDLASELTTEAKVRAVVLKSTDGRHSFELSAADGAVSVPAGSYSLHSGQLVLGESQATLSKGRSRTIEVPAGETTRLAWGGPVSAEFAYRRSGGQVQIAPQDISYFGRAGEEYRDFMPLGSSPRFEVKEKATGDVLVDMVFPGNC